MHRRQFIAGSSLAAATALLGHDAFAQDAVRMRELYNPDGSFSSYATERDGQRVVLEGFMAPPLKAESVFFVLTKIPMSVCPFCETEAEWPEDILAVYTRRVVDVVPFNRKITASGVLELGSHRDEETGFLSLVRLMDASYG